MIDILDEARDYAAVEGTDPAIAIAVMVSYFQQADRWTNPRIREIATKLYLQDQRDSTDAN